MRLSVDPGDRAYFGSVHAVVYLDGKPLKGCVTADEEAGEAFVFAKNAKGDYVIDLSGGAIVKERLQGEVRIECEDWVRREAEARQRKGAV